jgi:hypothetical protein
MTVAHLLRGYDRRTGGLEVAFGIGPHMLTGVRTALREADVEPELVDPYELTPDQTLRLAEVLGFSVEPHRLDYFIEAEEDWRVVAAIRDARGGMTCAQA